MRSSLGVLSVAEIDTPNADHLVQLFVPLALWKRVIPHALQENIRGLAAQRTPYMIGYRSNRLFLLAFYPDRCLWLSWVSAIPSIAEG